MSARLRMAVSPSSLALAGIVVLFWSFWGYGLAKLQVGGHIDVATWDWVTLLLVGIWILYVLGTEPKIGHSLFAGLLVSAAFAVWIGIQAARSPDQIRGLTMFALLLRDVMLYLIVGMLASRADLAQLNRVIFATGVIVAAVSIVLYLGATARYPLIVSDRTLWRPGIIYILGKGGILRLTGFAKDPNFYSLYMSIGLFCGLAADAKHRVRRWVGVTIIALSLLLAMSRAFLFALAVCTLLLFLLSLTVGRMKRRWSYFRTMMLSFGVIALSGGLITSVRFMAQRGNLLQVVIRRFAFMGESPRMGLWSAIWPHLSQNPLLGQGLRSAEAILGGTYSHNSYLDLLIETGMVGLLLWAALTALVTLVGLKRLRSTEMLPWFHGWLVFLVMLGAFSAIYLPYYWSLAAILLGATSSVRRTPALARREHSPHPSAVA